MDSLDKLIILSEVLEDAVQFICDEHMMSGEHAWSATSTLASLKLDELTKTVDSFRRNELTDTP